MQPITHLAIPLILLLTLAACATPYDVPAGSIAVAPRLGTDSARMPDGYRLPLRTWEPVAGGPVAGAPVVVLALHGFNDYGSAIAPLGERLAAAGIRTYAVDQRGFGASARAGRWHGSARMAADARVLLGLLRLRHPAARLVLLGESMGAAVAMLAVTRDRWPGETLPDMIPTDEAPVSSGRLADGLVLIAPAVWGRETMPWYQRLALTIAARTVPGLELTGEGVPIHPSDNAAMLRAMGADPLVIKATRVDALWGVTNLMDQALAVAPRLPAPVLLLYGEQDQIIPKPAFCALRERLLAALPVNGKAAATGMTSVESPGASAGTGRYRSQRVRATPDRGPSMPLRLVLYRDGWHMLPRDLQGARVNADIVAWLQDPRAALPSGEELPLASPRLDGFCDVSH